VNPKLRYSVPLHLGQQSPRQLQTLQRGRWSAEATLHSASLRLHFVEKDFLKALQAETKPSPLDEQFDRVANPAMLKQLQRGWTAGATLQ